MNILEKKDLRIKELNLSNPLFYGNLNRLMGKNFDFDVYLPTKKMNLQRDLVWNINQKRSLINSVFKEYFGSQNGIKLIPPISAVIHESENGEQIYHIIDGKQRLSTLISFVKNEFTLTDDMGIEYNFDQLSNELKESILRYSPLIITKYSYWDEPVTDQEKIDWFEMINFTGTPQEQEHLNKLIK